MYRDAYRIPFQQLDLSKQLFLLCRIRWAVIAAVIITSVVGWKLAVVTGGVTPLLILAGGLACLNVAYYSFLHHSKRSQKRAYAWFGGLQITMDLLVLVIVVHLTGGIENPVIFFFTFHIAIAAIMFGMRYSLFFAGVALLLGAAMAAAELFGWLAHRHLMTGPCAGTYTHPWAVLYFLFILACVCLGTSLLVSTIQCRAEKLQHQAAQHEQMASLGMLAAGVAHEIGNPLAAISAVAQMIRRRTTDVVLYERASLLLDHVSRIRKIVEDLVNFARPPETERRLVNINSVVQQGLNLIRYDPRSKNINIETDYADNLPPVRLSAEQLLQVCLNLFINALDAMENGGRLTVSTSCRDSEVDIAIQDSGTGIGEEISDRIFEPFFTTKPVGKGTGLGLSVSFGIIHSFGGTIGFKSSPGQGAVFHVLLPQAEPQGENNGSDIDS